MKNFLFFLIVWVLSVTTLPVSAQMIEVNQTFINDTTFDPFPEKYPVYSLKMTGSVEFFSDSSLVRVILVDSDSRHFLIYEGYPLICSSKVFDIDGVCDETCFLNGITPASIRVDLIDASINIDTLNMDPEFIENAETLQTQAKWQQDS